MDDWGKGMLQSQREYKIVGDYEEKFGLRELRAKINAAASFKVGKCGMQPIRLAIERQYCHGSRGVEITRQYLDSGPLAEQFETFFAGSRCWKGMDAVRFLTLAAGAMTLGCALPAKVKGSLGLATMVTPGYQKMTTTNGPPAFQSELARRQMEKALKNYVDGVPYDFGNKTTMYTSMMAGMFPGTVTTTEVGAVKLIEIKQSNGRSLPQIVGPPTDEEIGVQPIHAYDVCATCGNDKLKETSDGKLLVCGGCKERKYCSKACQKKHWSLHKPICSRPKEQMDKFLSAIPLDFAKDAEVDHSKLFGDSTVAMMSGDAMRLERQAE